MNDHTSTSICMLLHTYNQVEPISTSDINEEQSPAIVSIHQAVAIYV